MRGRSLEKLGKTQRILEKLGESWKSSESLGEVQRVLEKLRESWRSSENLGEAWKSLESLGEAQRILENLGESWKSVGTQFSADGDSIISHIKNLFAVLFFRVCYNEQYRNKCREGLCYCL